MTLNDSEKAELDMLDEKYDFKISICIISLAQAHIFQTLVDSLNQLRY
jgi:hypothetical protein